MYHQYGTELLIPPAYKTAPPVQLSMGELLVVGGRDRKHKPTASVHKYNGQQLTPGISSATCQLLDVTVTLQSSQPML